jgi:hypothetical protein
VRNELAVDAAKALKVIEETLFDVAGKFKKLPP